MFEKTLYLAYMMALNVAHIQHAYIMDAWVVPTIMAVALWLFIALLKTYVIFFPIWPFFGMSHESRIQLLLILF